MAEGQWHPMSLELVVAGAQAPVAATSQVLVPSPRAAFGVISDIDDTVLQSEVTTFLRAVRLMLLENARTRLPFPGVAAFYRALQAGRAGKPQNAIFYVSSSPWNLYDVISEFLDAQQIPAGPPVAARLGSGLRDSPAAATASTSWRSFARFLDAYPWMKVILIGDSGQADPEIYLRVVRRISRPDHRRLHSRRQPQRRPTRRPSRCTRRTTRRGELLARACGRTRSALARHAAACGVDRRGPAWWRSGTKRPSEEAG